MRIGDWTLKKKIGMAMLIVLALGAISFGGYYTWLITPPGPPKTAEEALKVINSDRFKHMPKYRQDEYLSATSELMQSMSDEDRRKMWAAGRGDSATREAMGNIREQGMLKQAIAYAQASPEDKVKMLDAEIDKMQARFADRGDRPQGDARPPRDGQGGPGGPGGGDKRDPGSMKERVKEHMDQRLQNGNPQANALMAEYHRAMRERMAQRGITGPGGGGGGRMR